jgi:hypothetical protein
MRPAGARHENGTPICHSPGPKERIPSISMQWTESLTLDNARMSVNQLREEVRSCYGIRLGTTKINELRHFLKDEFKPPKHILLLTPEQKQDQLWFAQMMLQNAWKAKNLIFSDESRFVLDGDKGCLWRLNTRHSRTA